MEIEIRKTMYKVISVYCLLKDHNGMGTCADKRCSTSKDSGGGSGRSCNENELLFIARAIADFCSFLCLQPIRNRFWNLIATK